MIRGVLRRLAQEHLSRPESARRGPNDILHRCDISSSRRTRLGIVCLVLRWAFCGRRRLRSASVNPENDLESSKAEDRVATTTTTKPLGMLLAKPGIGLVLGWYACGDGIPADVYLVHEVSSRSSHVVASPDSRNFFYPGVLSAIPYQGALVLSRLIILSVVLSILGAIGLLASR